MSAGPIEAPRPVAGAEREDSVDVLRGVALLGILAVNIVMFAWPFESYSFPALMGAGEGAARVGFATMHIVFYQKMVFLFSLLFGAGVVFYGRKFEGGRLSTGAGLWYRRMGWMLVIGLAHALLLWYGDILVWYAAVGLTALWWLRRLSPRVQMVLGGVLIVYGLVALTGFAALSAAFPPPEDAFNPSGFDQEFAVYAEGSYLDMLMHRFWMLLFLYILLLPLVYGPYLGGVMLLGQAFVRTGVLTGRARPAVYIVLAGVGLPMGWGLAAWGDSLLGYGAEAPERMPWLGVAMVSISGVFGGLGYVGLVVGLCKAGALGVAGRLLGNVGRMALSNYILQTLICTTLFYSYGFGLYGRIPYPQLWLVVVGVWAVNIVFSAVWLRHFRFGPMEWLWRSLTYWTLEPIRR